MLLFNIVSFVEKSSLSIYLTHSLTLSYLSAISLTLTYFSLSSSSFSFLISLIL